jgi:tetratricopeptide (TPR) repeat protein
MLAALRDLNQDLQQAKGIQLAIRVGVHTGLVVIGEMGGQGRQEQLALGEVPNVCARIQGLAEPNTIAVSEATYRLIQGYFACQDLGAQTLRGVAEPIAVYRVLGESRAQGRLDIAQTRGLTPLVGRESEVRLILERWEQVKAGHGHVVLLTGDAGIGKSRLVQVLKDHVANEPHMRWECRSAEYSQNTALFPLTDLFQRLLRFQAEDTPDEKLAKLEQMLSQYRLSLGESVPLFAPLLSLSLPENRYTPLNVSPQRQRQQILNTIIAVLLELAERQPVLFIVEDLHWTDPTTLECLHLLIEQIPTASVLVLLTCRPHFQPAWHHRSYLAEITVNRLSSSQVEQIVHRMTDGKTLPTEVRQQILAKADGVPLFVEEMTKAILELGQLTAVHGHYELAGSISVLMIPTTLQDSLMARLDRLVTAKAIAQYAAVIGRQFSYALLHAVSQVDEGLLQRELGRLVEAEIVYQRGAPPQSTYVFKHALIQDVAYQSLLKSTRQQYHQRIAQVLAAQFPETVEIQPELLAHHFTEAGLHAPAVEAWRKAGQRSAACSAYVEAIAHATKGLEVLAGLPETAKRTEQELALHLMLGTALQVTKGMAVPEVEQVYTRARECSQQVRESPQLVQALLGLRGFYQLRGDFHTARELGEQAVALASQVQDPGLVAYAHYSLGHTLFSLGAFATARAHFEHGVVSAVRQPQRAAPIAWFIHPEVFNRTILASALGYLGYVDQALIQVQQGCALAQELAHPPSLEVALSHTARVHLLRREAPLVHTHSAAALAIADEQGFAQRSGGNTVLRGWALSRQGQAEEGIAQIRQGIAAFRATRASAWCHYWLALLAEASAAAGQIAQGLTAVEEALTLVGQNGECFHEAELHRLQGELLLQQPSPAIPQALTCFRHALEVARRQEAKLLELRAAMSLARLWQRQEQHAEAHQLLAEIYGWFTEGFDTTDLQEAKALLDALA